MKSTGYVRALDELGRITLPKSIRESLDIEVKDAIEIFTDGNRIVLQKYEPGCIFCGNADHVIFYKEKRICEDCLASIKDKL